MKLEGVEVDYDGLYFLPPLGVYRIRPGNFAVQNRFCHYPLTLVLGSSVVVERPWWIAGEFWKSTSLILVKIHGLV